MLNGEVVNPSVFLSILPMFFSKSHNKRQVW